MAKVKTRSKFWADKWFSEDKIVSSWSSSERNTYDIYKLSAAKRAISNFVNIVTNKRIPVRFNKNDHSYTDGKTVVIGSNVTKPEDFDVAVGLALHEGSHIKLSDFKLLQSLKTLIPNSDYELGEKIGFTRTIILDTVKNLWNVVEDRRIDNFIYSTAPGYRGYYQSMYAKYFNNTVIDTALKSKKHTNEVLSSYMFRIINLHNPNTVVTALKSLPEIHKEIDLGNIDRLKNSQDAFEVALNVYRMIMKTISKQASDDKKQKSKGNKPSSQQLDDFKKALEGALEEAIENQQGFLDGEIEKEQLSEDEDDHMQTVENSGTELSKVGSDVRPDRSSIYPQSEISCIVVKKLTNELLNSEHFPLSRLSYGNVLRRDFEEEISRGIRLGTTLGKKLQIRSESRNTIFNRQKSGKIDRRMISSLGFGNGAVFQYNEVEQYNNANVHISIDASTSMGGNKWTKTLTNITSLCKAVDMIANLDIQVSIRTTSACSEDLPYIVLAYDSRVDKFSKVRKVFPCLHTFGTTPEGLCFEAIERNFIPSSNSMDSYFINISDGMPYFYNDNYHYSGQPAIDHTRNQVKKLYGKGIKVLSYFVSNGSSNYISDFRQMYGRSSEIIDVTNVGEIVKTINRLFLKK